MIGLLLDGVYVMGVMVGQFFVIDVVEYMVLEIGLCFDCVFIWIMGIYDVYCVWGMVCNGEVLGWCFFFDCGMFEKLF